MSNTGLVDVDTTKTETELVCGFHSVNQHHCVIDSRCIVCGATGEPTLEKGQIVQLIDFGKIDGSYRVISNTGGKLQLKLDRG